MGDVIWLVNDDNPCKAWRDSVKCPQSVADAKRKNCTSPCSGVGCKDTSKLSYEADRIVVAVHEDESVNSGHVRQELDCLLLPGMDGTGMLFEEFSKLLDASITPTIVRYPANRILSYPELEKLVFSAVRPNRDFLLLAESFSGPIAVSIAARRPAALVGVVLCNTFVRPPIRFASILSTLVPLIPLRNLPRSWLSALLTGSRRGHVSDALFNALSHVSRNVLCARLKAALKTDVVDLLEQIDVPVLCIRSQNDWIVPRAATVQLNQRLRRCKTVELPGPHLIIQAVPVQLGSIVSQFALDCQVNRRRKNGDV
jgi:pimeloyl-ACP methyl ester carboxylesterase